MKQLYRRELDRVRKAPQGRGKKSVAREQKFYELQDNFLEKKKTLTDSRIKLDIVSGESIRLGNKIMIVKSLYKSFGEKCVLNNFSHEFRQGERIGIVGKNGV